MTPLKKSVSRAALTPLGGEFGSDRGARLVITLIPGNGQDVPDTIELRPMRTRRVETIAVMDVYRYALRCRVGRETLEKARARKAKRAEVLARRRQAAAERRFSESLKGVTQ